MKDKLRVEDELLLCCARTNVEAGIRDKILFLVQGDLDWDYLLKLAMRHRLMPLLYYNLNSICAEDVPESILSQLKGSFHENVRRNLLLTGELVKILKLLELNDINAVTYKGPVLASLAYNNIGFRQFGDIDILINKSDALKVKNILISNGYELYPPINVKDSVYMKLDSEYRFINKITRAKVEINWNFEGTFFSFPINPDFLFNGLKRFDLNGFTVYTFPPVNQLLMLCIHCAKHDFSRLSWICDISEFIKTHENINWHEILEKAEKLGVKRILLINLFLVIDFFGLKFPKEILYHLDSDSSAIKISNQIKIKLFNYKSFNIFGKFFLDLKRRESLENGLNDCIRGLTRYSYKDFEDFPLPKSLFSLYIFIRPFLLLKRW